jgi:2-polyprenyl-3-methyl-5-hydroxy-6-metoxy-1,4-benzoquinol methylase
MPVNEKQTSGVALYQREQYQKGGISQWYWDYKDNIVLNEINELDNTILDIGCGEGILLEKLTKRYPHRNIVGLDTMPENVQIGSNLGLPVKLGDIYHLDLPDNSMDVVILMEVIEHLVNPDLAFEEIHKVLKPGGKLLIVFPNDAFFLIARILTLKFKEAAYDPGHQKQWTHREIRGFLNDHNFDVKSSISIPFLWWPISLHGVTLAFKRKT